MTAMSAGCLLHLPPLMVAVVTAMVMTLTTIDEGPGKTETDATRRNDDADPVMPVTAVVTVVAAAVVHPAPSFSLLIPTTTDVNVDVTERSDAMRSATRRET